MALSENCFLFFCVPLGDFERSLKKMKRSIELSRLNGLVVASAIAEDKVPWFDSRAEERFVVIFHHEFL